MNVVRWTALAAGAAAVAGATWLVRDVLAALGAEAKGERAERVQRSPQFRDGKFHNTVPPSVATVDGKALAREWFRRDSRRKPAQTVPVVSAAPGASTDGLHITWLGHATCLIEIEGRRVLIDPIWNDRCSPSRLVGPKRLHPVPFPLAALPEVDAVVISHDHYDHLDMDTIRTLAREQSMPFLLPLGVGAHLQRWGVPDERIIELDWDEQATVAGSRSPSPRPVTSPGGASPATVRCGVPGSSPVRAGRCSTPATRGTSTGSPGSGPSTARSTPASVQVGAYGEGWPDIHMTPEDGVRAHVDVGGGY
jgi:hypothetical protein